MEKISNIQITFLYTCVHKGERLKKKESIFDVRTHFKPTETFQYSLCEKRSLKTSKKTLQKEHLKKILLFLIRDYATEVTPITLQIKLSQKSFPPKECRPYKTNKKGAKTFCPLLQNIALLCLI